MRRVTASSASAYSPSCWPRSRSAESGVMRASRTRSRSRLSTRSTRRSSVWRSNALRLCTTISGARCASRSSFSTGTRSDCRSSGALAVPGSDLAASDGGQTPLGRSCDRGSDPGPGQQRGELGADVADFDRVHLAASELVDAHSTSDRRRRKRRRTRRRPAATGSCLAATNSSSSSCRDLRDDR